MKDLSVDIQSMIDDRRVPIQRVGIHDLQYPLRVQWKNGTEFEGHAHFDIAASLPETQRGIHMSRFVAIVHRWHRNISWQSLQAMIGEISQESNAPDAYFSCSFTYFRNKVAPVSALRSMMGYDCSLSIRKNTHATVQALQIAVPTMTLCPCSKALSEYGAHNQRSICTVQLQSPDEPDIDRLIDVIEASSSSPLYAMLKRADEQLVTEQSYNTPRFVEDLLREIVIFLRKDKPAWFSINISSAESIHNHNAYAYTEEGEKQ